MSVEVERRRIEFQEFVRSILLGGRLEQYLDRTNALVNALCAIHGAYAADLKKDRRSVLNTPEFNAMVVDCEVLLNGLCSDPAGEVRRSAPPCFQSMVISRFVSPEDRLTILRLMVEVAVEVKTSKIRRPSRSPYALRHDSEPVPC